MKRHLRNILIGIALGVALVYLTSCRTIQRSRSAADSSSTRTEASAEKWAREVVTEYIPTSGGPSLPSIALPDWLPLQFLRGGQSVDTVRVAGPRGPAGYFRQTRRESGEKQVAKTEEKDTAVTEKAVERGWSPIQERALLLVSWAAVIAAVGLVLLGIARLLRPARPAR